MLTDRKRAQNALRELAIVEERNRIAREIHDTFAQAFTGILIQLEAAQDVLKSSKRKTKTHIDHARSLAKNSLVEARRSVWELRPRILAKEGLSGAIKHLALQFGFTGLCIKYSTFGKPCSPRKEIENNVLRISQQALTNTIQHSHATKVQIKLIFKPKIIQLVINDNGKGFRPKDSQIGFGLISMKERAEQMNGKLKIESKPGQGTTIQLSVPIKS